ncbi:MAG: ribonuclease P protein component [Candidatus Moranbacteria bacterium]|nr:ribonuclease P protein component [Candidatus Moranbacteria bacterium]
MLPVQFRLKNKKDFNEVFRRGKTVSNEVLIMKYEKAGGGELKIGFSVGIKLSKKATERNGVKRWLREATKLLLRKIRTGHQIIFLINSKFPYEQISYPLIEEKTKDLLMRAKLIE